MPHNYLVTVGSVKAGVNTANTHGTGFIVSVGNVCYMATCRQALSNSNSPPSNPTTQIKAKGWPKSGHSPLETG